MKQIFKQFAILQNRQLRCKIGQAQSPVPTTFNFLCFRDMQAVLARYNPRSIKAIALTNTQKCNLSLVRYSLCSIFAPLLFFTLQVLSFSQQQEPSFVDTVFKTLSGVSSEEITVKITPWKYKKNMDARCVDPNFIPEKWGSTGLGYMWTQQDSDVWFWTKLKIPEEINGKKIKGTKAIFRATVDEGGDIYINGEKKQLFRGKDGETLLSNSTKPGEEYIVVIRGYNRSRTGIFADAYISFSALDEIQQKITNYLYNVNTVKSLLERVSNKDKYLKLLEKSASKIDLDAVKSNDKKRLSVSIDAANKELQPFSEIAKEYTMYLTGYSHIDLAWLWDVQETKDVWYNTSRTVLDLMNEYPEFVFAQSQAHGYIWMEKEYPKLFEEIKQRVKEGRWEIVGGTMVEPDSNLPCGESFVRQYLYGKRYFRQKFDKDIVIGWTPDSFGYNWNLPQIMKKSGIIGFLTQKISWNDTTRFPYHIFWWQGADGSRVLTYFPMGSYVESVDPSTMLEQVKGMENSNGLKENFIIFGLGDHGGGVTRTHLNRAFDTKNSSIYPNVKFIKAEDYFKHLLQLAGQDEGTKAQRHKGTKELANGEWRMVNENSNNQQPTTNNQNKSEIRNPKSEIKDFPTWNDELYLEYHRGTFTSQAENKKSNRENETLLMNTEKISSIARDFGLAYNSQDIYKGWHILTFNQFHDILPGSSIRKVYEDSHREYEELMETENAVLLKSLKTIAENVNTEGKGIGEPVILFNPLSWTRNGIVEIPLENAARPIKILNSKGEFVPCQIVRNVTGSSVYESVVFVASNIPSVGYAVYWIVPGSDSKNIPSTDLKVSETDTATEMENSFLKVKINNTTGYIESLFDKSAQKEIIGQEGTKTQEQSTKKLAIGEWRMANENSNNQQPTTNNQQLSTINQPSATSSAQLAVGSYQSPNYQITKLPNHHQPSAPTGGGIIQLFEDRHPEYDAWNIRLKNPVPIKKKGKVEIVENGPVRVTVKAVFESEKSQFEEYYSLYNNYPMLIGKLEIDWHEYRTMAKLAFNLNMKNEDAWFEIPYAALSRKAIPKTREDEAKWEVSAQKWVDYSDASGTYGMSLLNNSKYGYDVKNNVLRMSLLRSPKDPDPLADMGHHSIPYAVYPHKEDWRTADTPRRGYEFNYPIVPVRAKKHSGNLPSDNSFYSVDVNNVFIEVIKKAEDSDATIVRLFEAYGNDSTVVITLPKTPKKVMETNLLEEDIAPVNFEGNKISLMLGHFEIKTLKIE